jgi:hypothetical protein
LPGNIINLLVVSGVDRIDLMRELIDDSLFFGIELIFLIVHFDYGESSEYCGGKFYSGLYALVTFSVRSTLCLKASAVERNGAG